MRNTHAFEASNSNFNLCSHCGLNVYAFIHGANKSASKKATVRTHKHLACKFCRHAFKHHNDDGCDKCFDAQKECVGYWE